MATNGDISVLKVSGTSYNVKDTTARTSIAADPNKILVVSSDSSGSYDYNITFNTSASSLINLAEEEF